MTPLSIASHGLLDSGPTPALAIAVQGFLAAEAIQPPVQIVDFDTHDGKRRWGLEERERQKLEDERRLRKAVERAFRKANGEDDEPGEQFLAPEPPTVPATALVLADGRLLDGISLSLREIEQQVEDLIAREQSRRMLEWQRAVEAWKQAEDDALMILLMVA